MLLSSGRCLIAFLSLLILQLDDRNDVLAQSFESDNHDDDGRDPNGDEIAFIHELEDIEVTEIRNDRVTIFWRLPDETANVTTRQRVNIIVLRGGDRRVDRQNHMVTLNATERTHVFAGLTGNVTYRPSVEAFSGVDSVWYGSTVVTTSLADLDWLAAPSDLTILDKTLDSLEVSWSMPPLTGASRKSLVNQHVVTVYEYFPTTRTFAVVTKSAIPLPHTTFRVGSLTPGSVYNVTVRAATDNGYGALGWSAYSTLPPGTSFLLKLRARSPDSLTLSWPADWMPKGGAQFTVRAETIHSVDAVEKAVSESGVIDSTHSVAQHTLRQLQPGATYNITLTAIERNALQPQSPHHHSRRRVDGHTPSNGGGGESSLRRQKKHTWAVYSTLAAGEYAPSEARLVVETDHAASVVFQRVEHPAPVKYQLRYVPVGGGPDDETILDAMDEEDLRCPKWGCDWLCALVFNLPQRARDFSFEVRVRVDGRWNKWTPIVRRPWSVLERVCSINPPPYQVENIGQVEYQRELELDASDDIMDGGNYNNVWRYLVVVDRRRGDDIADIDMKRLGDRAASDFDHVPYYIAASLTPHQVESRMPFSLGDGKVWGGYLNYPLRERDTDPRWTLVPVSHRENELMEPKLRSCGFTEQGVLECDLTLAELVASLPGWLQSALLIGATVFLIIFLCCCCVCCIRQCMPFRNETTTQHIMYYEDGEPPRTTTEYRKVEQREFRRGEERERQAFLTRSME